ncbi:peptidoglycan DD-metalloendopeptidase family protein [Marinivivus vitaminiproducens]|uniref:peptidoglycan DD-metalloendopeptidase family protein n=1 Tax=Marinivivus vitaminiproducens TaxID=3035935 RepID=UPI00279D92C9|nr:M23 family metallopeptidase [Geminicoccaceae bacterium SCSIO 64248]
MTVTRLLPMLAVTGLLVVPLANCTRYVPRGGLVGDAGSRSYSGSLSGNRYVPTSGDTISGIAQRFGVSQSALAQANSLRAPYTIYVGQPLIIPDRASSSPYPSRREQAVAVASARQTLSEPSGGREGVVEARASAATAPAALSGGGAAGFTWPVEGRIVSRFGDSLDGRPNDGINIVAPAGAPVRAAAAGTVVYAGDELPGYGNLVLIRHDDGYISAYAHNASLVVALGDTVTGGQIIARVGQTGSVSRPQLHFRIRHDDKAVDPVALLGPSGNQVVASD